MATNATKYIPTPAQELANQWIRTYRTHNDPVLQAVDESGSASYTIGPSGYIGIRSATPGVAVATTSAATDLSAGAAPSGSRALIIAEGPPSAAPTPASRQLPERYKINAVTVNWDAMTGFPNATDRVYFLLAKLDQSAGQTLILSSDVTKSKLGVNYAPKASDSTTPPGISNGQLLALDTNNVAASANVVAQGRVVFDLTKDLTCGVAAQSLTRTEESMVLEPGDRLVLIMYPVNTGQSSLVGTLDAVKAWGVSTDVILEKLER